MIVDGDAPLDWDPARAGIEVLTRSGRRSLVGVLARAFRDNPMNVRIHGPDPRRRIRANAAGLRSLVLDHAQRVIVMGITYNSRVIGGFVLAPPGERRLPGPSFRRQVECLCLQGRAAIAAWSEVAIGVPDHRPAEDHWYVAVLGVEPAWQGRGVGAALLAEIDRRVSRDPRPICLESDRPASVRFYQRHGFAIRAEGEVHSVPCWCLGRGFPPGTAECPP